MTASSSNPHNPLPLEDLRPWILSNEEYEWIRKADEKDAAFRKEMEEEGADAVAGLFSNEEDEDDEMVTQRVQLWSSSATNPNGVGGYQTDKEQEVEEGSVRVLFVLSESWEGFGGLLWASARYIANVMAYEEQCRVLLEPLLKQKETTTGHPLLATSFLELGAGAGVPSWAAMRCGARVVCTDLAKENRVRCMAESAERNWREMRSSLEEKDPILANAQRAKSCPHDWGTPVDKILKCLNENGSEKFDVVVAADCLYMPQCHSELLDSVKATLSERGVALLPFALHGNTDDASVWGIVDIAKEKGFNVETLESQQLTPSYTGMEAKQGLVHTLRLTL